MSKAQKFKQQQKDQKAKAAAAKNATPGGNSGYADTSKMTLKEKQAANKEALRKHQASMTKLKEFEAKLHPAPAGAVKEEEPKSALADMFFDGGNLSKDASRTQPPAMGYHPPNKDVSPSLGTRSVEEKAHVSHEKDTAIKH